MSIRIAKRQDFPSTLTLLKEFSVFKKTPEKVSISLEQMIKGKATYPDDLYVKTSYKKQGIGKKLLEAVIGHAKKSNAKNFAGRCLTGTPKRFIFIKASVQKLMKQKLIVIFI